MRQLSASWRVAVRAARRDLWKSKGRNALIAVMVGLPVMLTVVVVGTSASSSLTLQERLPDDLGRAQASATYVGGAVMQDPLAETWTGTGESDTTSTVAQRAAKLAEVSGGEVSVAQRNYSAVVVIGDRGFKSSLLAADARANGPSGMVKLGKGRLPQGSDEVMVTPALEKSGAKIGTSVEVGVNGSMDVVGVGRIGLVTRQPSRQAVLGLPGAFEEAKGETSYLIDQPQPVSWSAVKRINTAGFIVLSKDVIAHPPASEELYPEEQVGVVTSQDNADTAVLAIAVTAIMIQIVLLAGPAFAVGVRRQGRDLALLAATGASPKQVRRIVLGQAVVIGLVSCLMGAAAGAGLAALIVRFVPDFTNAEFGPYEVLWQPILASILLGVAAAALAAYVPARRASQQDVAAVLSGRRGVLRSSRGWPVLGAILAGAGLMGCFTLGQQPGGETFVAASTIAIVIGFVMLTPVVIGLVGRLGAVLPLSLRLALRDTSRHRARSAPAIAAVMAAVAGVTAFAIASSSDFEQSRREYVYESPPGRLIVTTEAGKLDETLEAVSSVTGSMKFTPIAWAGLEDPNGNGTFVGVVAQVDYVGMARIAVTDVATVKEWGVTLDRGAQQALADGKAVVADPGLIKQGLVEIDISVGEESTTARVPAVAADLSTGSVPRGPEPLLGSAIITPEIAKAHEIPYEVTTAVSSSEAAPVGPAMEQAAAQAARGVSPNVGSASVERGFQETYTVPFLALLGFGVVAVLVGTMTATGLALSDARPDFSTLAAIGAAPRTRRRVAGAQAIVLATLGTLMGIVVGFGPGVAASWPLTSDNYQSSVSGQTSHVLDIPWVLLAALVVIVPLIAALAAALFTRSRLPIVRRLAQ